MCLVMTALDQSATEQQCYVMKLMAGSRLINLISREKPQTGYKIVLRQLTVLQCPLLNPVAPPSMGVCMNLLPSPSMSHISATVLDQSIT